MSSTLVRELMSAPVHAARPHWRLARALHLIIEESITALPVLDDDGDLLGILTEADLVTARLADPRCAASTVGEAMTRDVLTLRPSDDLTVALARLGVGGRRALPVIEGGQLVGIITRRDVLGLPRRRRGG